MSGTLFVVATPIGNLEDITVRALRVLREVSVIAAEDTRHTAQLLARHAITTPTTSLHEHNEAGKSPALIARLERGENIALVSDAGTPTISDPGGRADPGRDRRGDPGRADSRAQAVTGGHAVGSGCPPTRSLSMAFPQLGRKTEMTGSTAWSGGGTVVFFEAPHRIRANTREFSGAVGDCQVVVARELTKVHEELVRGPISEVLHTATVPRGEFTVIVEIGHYTQKQHAVREPIGAAPRQSVRPSRLWRKSLWRFDERTSMRALEGLRNSGDITEFVALLDRSQAFC